MALVLTVSSVAEQRAHAHVLLRCYGDLFVHSRQRSGCVFSLAFTHLLYIAVVVQCGFAGWILEKSAIPSFRLFNNNK